MANGLTSQWNKFSDLTLTYAQRVQDAMNVYAEQGPDTFGKKFRIELATEEVGKVPTISVLLSYAGSKKGDDAIRVDIARMAHSGHNFTVRKYSGGEEEDLAVAEYDFSKVLSKIDNFAERVSPHLARQVKTSRDYNF